MKIRKATASDIDAITAIDIEISGLAKPEYWRELMQFYRKQKQTDFFLVAEHEKRVTGFILGEIRAWEFGSSPCGWVFAIGVKKETRLHGIGAMMLDTLGNAFSLAGATKIRTMVLRKDHELLAFFRSQGLMAGPYLQLEKNLD